MSPQNSQFALLQREGYLTRFCLLAGFSATKRANLERAGDFYVAFFQLSIGLERLMKLTLILGHMATNELKLPDYVWLKKTLSHKLVTIFDEVYLVAQRYGQDGYFSEIMIPSSLEHQILTFLGEFAEKTRYANLNALTRTQVEADPLERWNGIVKQVFENEVPSQLKRRLKMNAQAEGIRRGDSTIIEFHNLEGQSLTVEQYWLQEAVFEKVAPSIVWHTMRILHPICKLLYEVTAEARSINLLIYPSQMIVPDMDEFFIDFVSSDRDEVMDTFSEL